MLWTVERDWIQYATFPGGESIGLGKLPVDTTSLQGLYGALEDMRASFICSGPFPLKLTIFPSEHLILGGNGEIKLFWEGYHAAIHIPGKSSFLRYRYHTLGKYTFHFETHFNIIQFVRCGYDLRRNRLYFLTDFFVG